MLEEKWVGYCEMCGSLLEVTADNEKEAIELSNQTHQNACIGGPLVAVAFKASELPLIL